MGVDSMVVVDDQLRVRGLARLRVADAGHYRKPHPHGTGFSRIAMSDSIDDEVRLGWALQ